ncbi:MAG TPA: prepilin-type N-terminal cleavage/methylation domain-containing protein [Mycobacteriales bacterium]|jgi:type IV pilus assembly protein PilA
MPARIRRSSEHGDDDGFTLIELLVVIIVIGILAAIAIPVYLNQRNKAYDSAARADTKALALQEEAWLTAHDAYTDTVAAGTLTEFRQTAGVRSRAKAKGAQGFCIVSLSRSGHYFWYDSEGGGLHGPSATAPTGGICDTDKPDLPV